jgi:hypothetical protein
MIPKVPEKNLEDRLISLEPPCPIPEENRIGRMLDLYGSPFLYHKAQTIDDLNQYQIGYPSFTLPGYDGLIEDCPGNLPPSDPEPIYRTHDLAAVVTSSYDLAQPRWPGRPYERYARPRWGYERFSKPYS